METRANYLIVGLFTLAILASGFGFVWWVARPSQRIEGQTYEIAYDGAVSGLRVGSSVMFNGIRVGEVRSLKLDPANPRRVVASVVVDSSAPILSDTKASLEYQGLTGIASVSLTGGERTAPPLAKGPNGVPQLFAESSAMQDMMAVVRRVAGQAEGVLTRLDRLIADNQGDVRTTVSNVAQFSDRLNPTMDRVDKLIAAIDPEKVRSTIDGLEAFSKKLGENSPKVDAIMSDAGDLARKLNAMADRLDRILGNVEGLTGSADGKGVIADISGAAKAVRDLAERLDKRTEELTVEGRRTLNDFDRTLRNLERNPRQFIFGGGGVPGYSSRR